MKKIFLFAVVALASVTAFSQKHYVGGSISMTNGSALENATYASVEAGWNTSIGSCGLAIGRSSLGKAVGAEKNMWFVEPKANFTLLEKGKLKGYLVAGVGGFLLAEDVSYFVEYGAGVAYNMKKNYSFSTQISNWNGANFVSFGLSKSF